MAGIWLSALSVVIHLIFTKTDEMGTVISLILQMRYLKHREVR